MPLGSNNVKQATEPGRNGTLAVTAALLHDVDRGYRHQPCDGGGAVRTRCSGAAVMALTKNADLPKEQRMPDSLERIRAQSLEVWMVKLADRIVNLGPPPAHWARDKMAAYQAEAETILSALRDASPFLARRLEQRIAEYVIYLDGTGLPHLPSRAG